MGKQQFYKGNPELKQYFLVNDFTGGINTTSVDERTADNEFRELLNVELIRTGMIQNRKGWGNTVLLNELIATKNITLPTGKYAMLKVVKDENNLLQVLNLAQSEGKTFGEFSIPLYYDLEILMIYEQNGIRIGLLSLNSLREDTANPAVQIDPSAFIPIARIASGSFTDDVELTSLETVNYTDFVYFPLSAVNSSLRGFGEYNIRDRSFRIIRDDELPNGSPPAYIYKPNGYEVSNFGFNVLSNNPFSDISRREGFFNITGLFLSQYQVSTVNGQTTVVDTSTPLLGIPPNGEVTLNVVFTGDNVSAKNFVFEFFITKKIEIVNEDGEIKITESETPLQAKRIAAVVPSTSGVARFAFNIEVQNLPQIFIRIKLSSGVTLATAKLLVDPEHKFADGAALQAYFNEAQHTFIATPDSNDNSRMFLYRKTNLPYNYTRIDQIGLTSPSISQGGGPSRGVLYDATKLTQNKQWSESNITDYTNALTSNKRSLKLQELNNALIEADCDDFAELTVESINDPASDYYLAPTDPLDYIIRVERTASQEVTNTTPTWGEATQAEFDFAVANNQLWTTTGYNSGANSDAFNALTFAQLGALASPDLNRVVRVEGTFTTPKSWSPTSNTGFSETKYYPVSTSCSDLDNVSNQTLINWLNQQVPLSGKGTGYIVKVAGTYGSSSSAGFWTESGSSGTVPLTYPTAATCPSSSTLKSWLDANYQSYSGGTTAAVSSSATGAKSFATTSSTNFTATINYVSSSTTCGFTGLTALQMANAAASASSYATGTIIRVVEFTSDGAICTPEVGFVTVVESPTTCTTRYFVYTAGTSGGVVQCTTNYRYFIVDGGVATPTTPRYRYAKYTQGTSTQLQLCNINDYPVSYKYYRITQNAIGFTSGAIVFGTELVNDVETGFIYYMINGIKTKMYYYSSPNIWNTTPNSATVVKRSNNISLKIPSEERIYFVGTDEEAPGNYYSYNGGIAGTFAADFATALITDVAVEVEYNDEYEVKITENPKPVEQLQTNGFRMIEANSRLILYKDNIIWFSALYQFDYIPSWNYVVLPLTTDDRITNISYFKGSYMIFTKERIYKMSGIFGTPEFQIQIVNDSIGCISPHSVKPFNNTLVFMSHDGIYRIKQNYYQNGLENVEKIDKQLNNITPYNRDVYSVLYNEQYLLFYKYKDNEYDDAPFSTLKMYYNIQAPQGYPYVKDKYAIQPQIIAKFDDGLYSIRNGLFYKYDVEYTDFLPPGQITETERLKSIYTVKIRTHKLTFGYPTHDKKFKAVLIKDIANEIVPLFFDIYVDNFKVYTHTQFKTTIDEFGRLIYEEISIPNTYIGSDNLVGDFELNKDQLGDLSARVHKIVFSGKGKGITLDIERRTAQQFSIQDIGYVYKVGKAREDR
jgi:hypothetical protein